VTSDSDGYFSRLVARFGEAWNRFWFTPSDPISTAVLRIGVGAIVLYSLATYGFELRRFFDPQYGMLPVATVEAMQIQTDRALRFSYLDYATDGTTLQVLHYGGLAVVAAFVVGLFTRVASVLTLVVFLSYYHRAPMLTSVAEPVLAFLLFYLCFAPAGAELSVDAWRRRRFGGAAIAAPYSYAATVSLRLIQVHTALVYFLMFSGKQQNNFSWWNGTAVWWLIARTDSALVNLRGLNEYPYLINLWTTFIFLFEPAFALLIWNRTARPLLLGLSVFAWTGIALITGLVPFSLAMFVAGLSFVSAETWRRWLICCGVQPLPTAVGRVGSPTA